MATQAELDERVLQVYGALGQTVVLPKGLSLRVRSQGQVPRYVSEFLLAQQPVEDAAATIRDYLEQHHPLPRDRNLWRHRLVQEGTLRIVDRLDVAVDVQDGSHCGRIGSLGLSCRLDPALAERHPGLLSGGMWGRIDLDWAPVGEGVPATVVRDFRPAQVRARLDQFLEGRHYFSALEWIDLLLTSAGYAPDAVCRDVGPQQALRLRLLLLMRLAPLVEPSLHLLELGPKNTGKTYLARNVSPDAFVISGGSVTPANLFVHLTTGVPGLLAQRRLVAFDEIARLRLGSAEVVAALKDFLESGQFSRGRYEFSSDCSVVLLGNIDVEGNLPSPRYRHLCEPLPEELRDSAFIDRLHAFLPGWELPKLGPESFAQGVGFVSDYFGEVLVRLRSLPFEGDFQELTAPYPLQPAMTRRDAAAVERVARGLLKLVFPTAAVGGDRAVLEAILSLAGELRQRVHEQLCRLAPGEFQPRAIGYENVPNSPAQDLVRRDAAATVRAATGVGEVMFLDRETGGAEGGGQLRRVETSLLQRGRGLRIEGRLQPDAAESARIAHSVIMANARQLRLDTGILKGRSLVLQVPGGPVVDGESLALPAFLAMVSSIRGEPFQLPVVAMGGSTLHGRLTTSGDVTARLGALQGQQPGLLVLPRLTVHVQDEIHDLLPGWRLVTADDLWSVLREL